MDYVGGMGAGTLARQAGVREAVPQDHQQAPSPEEQELYDQFVNNALQIMAGQGERAEVNPQILQSLQAAHDPILNLATTASSLIIGLVESAAKANHKLSPDIIYQGGVEIIEQLADIAEAAKIHDYSEEELESAIYNCADVVIKANPAGIVDQQGAAAEFEQVVQANNQGTLEQQTPLVGEYNRMRHRAPNGGD